MTATNSSNISAYKAAIMNNSMNGNDIRCFINIFSVSYT